MTTNNVSQLAPPWARTIPVPVAILRQLVDAADRAERHERLPEAEQIARTDAEALITAHDAGDDDLLLDEVTRLRVQYSGKTTVTPPRLLCDITCGEDCRRCDDPSDSRYGWRQTAGPALPPSTCTDAEPFR